MSTPTRRRNVYRDTRRADDLVSLIVLLAAIILAALVATSERPGDNDVYDARDYTYTYTPQH